MDFIGLEHINILPRDTNEWLKAKELKKRFIEGNINKEHINIHIDDSHEVLKKLEELDNGMILLHVTSLID
jgi:disulfide oxidoreductase YuzD